MRALVRVAEARAAAARGDAPLEPARRLELRRAPREALRPAHRGSARAPSRSREPESLMSWRIGVDIGGTFTDVVLADEARGAAWTWSRCRRRRATSRGSAGRPRTATRGATGGARRRSRWLAHATTVVTNALLQGKGARIALLTTQGMRDVLELRRSARASLYDLFQDAPARARAAPPAPGDPRARGRAGPGGDAAPPRGRRRGRRVHPRATRSTPWPSACSSRSSTTPTSARSARGSAPRCPDVPVFLSSEVLPEIREFERTSTTAVCAYVGPILASYLAASKPR